MGNHPKEGKNNKSKETMHGVLQGMLRLTLVGTEAEVCPVQWVSDHAQNQIATQPVLLSG